jgi:hypothetical protein
MPALTENWCNTICAGWFCKNTLNTMSLRAQRGNLNKISNKFAW